MISKYWIFALEDIYFLVDEKGLKFREALQVALIGSIMELSDNLNDIKYLERLLK